MSKWIKLPIVIVTVPLVYAVFILMVFPLLMASLVYVVLATAGFFSGGDPDKIPLWIAFNMVERYFELVDSL